LCVFLDSGFAARRSAIADLRIMNADLG
jgi:hypothetical protein